MKRISYGRRIQFEILEARHMMAYLAGDYSQNGVVDSADYDVWRAEYGNVIESPADGNGDGTVDSADYNVWRKNFGKTLADVPPDAPRLVDARAVGATNIQVTWQAAANTTSYSVQRRQPGTETDFTTIASGLTLTTYTDNTAVADTLSEYRVVAQNAHGSSTGSQTAQATANKSNLTAYRPQSVQDPVSAPTAPIYDRPTNGGLPGGFPKRAVSEQDETSSTLGPGIRVNLDDDNLDGIPDASPSEVGPIPLENDLIEVKIDRLPGQGNLVLTVGGNLALYYDYDKTTFIPLTAGTSAPLNFTNNTATVFVEWVNFDHGTDNLSLVDPATSTTLDTIRFHSFRSFTVVFGGRAQNPRDTDGDGSIGDVVTGTNREGIFDLAQNLYNTGWDVMAFEVPAAPIDINPVISFAEIEIANAVFFRNVGNYFDYFGGVNVMGYSWGGGAAHDLIERLSQNEGITTLYGVYLDAIVYGGVAAQDAYPNETAYLLNMYETNTFLPHGIAIDPNTITPGATVEDVNTTTAPGYPGNLTHYTIDDDAQVQQHILSTLVGLMLR
jgi:hypothetical protein